MGIQLQDGAYSEIPRYCEIIHDGWEHDDFWEPAKGTATRDDQIKYFTQLFDALFVKPSCHYYKMVDEDNGKIVGWTCLQSPAPMTEEEKNAHPDLPDPPKGVVAPLIPELFTILGLGDKNGYNPEEHFHRRGTFIDPTYQKRGLGSRLTQECNRVADRAGGKIFVPARPSSKPMFEQNGFVVKDTYDVDMEPYTGKKHIAKNWLLIREPQPVVNGA